MKKVIGLAIVILVSSWFIMQTFQTTSASASIQNGIGSSDYRAQRAIAVASKFPELYLAVEHHRNSVGQPMTFAGNEWLIPIYKDKTPNQVYIKSVQCGITELLIIRLLQRCYEGRSALYILPSLEFRNKFVTNRIDRMVERVPFYRAGMKGSDNTGLKSFWKGVANFAGSNVIGAFREFPAQDLFIDEFDLCDFRNLVYAYDRLASAVQMGFTPTTTTVSNPTVTQFGIDKAYADSDKKAWHIKCSSCGTWQSLDWFANVVDQNGTPAFSPFLVDGQSGSIRAVCRSCHKPIDRLASGEWVAEHPGHPTSGYHISKLFTRQTTLDAMYALFLKGQVNETEKQHFINSELGLAYSGGGESLSLEVFQKCAIAGYQLPLTGENCVAGVDVGGMIHIRIDSLLNGRRRMVFAGAVPNFEDLAIILNRYNVRLYVIDARPETHKAMEFVSKRRGGYRCDFNTESSVAPMKIDRDGRLIKIGRTISFDEATEAYLMGMIELPENWRSLDNGNFVLQMMAPVRILDTDRKPPAFIWDERGQPDHHRLADNYCHIAARLRGFGSGSFKVQWI